jgi:hypothetical protein
MRALLRLVLVGLALLSVPLAASAQAGPDALLKDLYRQHSPDKGFSDDAAIRARFFSVATGAKLAKLFATDEGGLGFDPFYNGQDVQDGGISNLKIGQPKVTGAKAVVTVTFKNFSAQQLDYELVREANGWRIADIAYSGSPKFRLSDSFK